MWCWHRIRESETGLCPACRTPYGEDPHQFTAVDVEDVSKRQNKKEPQSQLLPQQRKTKRHQDIALGGTQNNLSSSSGAANTVSSSAQRSTKAKANTHGSGSVNNSTVDRSSLANMRVIRRNLVYAIGIPGHLSLETLKKPEYFGQYGKIHKMVLNNSNSAEGQRSSAYVTFVHDEDALACILALDGAFIEDGKGGRSSSTGGGATIRASYGTSKYCSSFVKHTRCSNPECTYLHELGADEDTFTKQEIQAGYVTSGRDVLDRQQQILQEQLQQQQQNGSGPARKRIGGGGPSGTGRPSLNPVFPPPEFDEPTKPAPSTAHLVPAPPKGTSLSRSKTAGANPTTSTTVQKVPLAGKVLRTASAGTTAQSMVPKATAASVVAGLHGQSKESVPDPHTTLTSLTPLNKRSTSSNALASKRPDTNIPGPNPLRNGRKGPQATSILNNNEATSSAPAISGEIIGAPNLNGNIFVPASSGSAIDRLGGEPINLGSASSSGLLGGEIFTGQLPHQRKSTIGGDPLGGTPLGRSSDGGLGDAGLFGGRNMLPGRSSSAGVIGGQLQGNQSTSTLASILGVDLPTGSGALHDSIWPGHAVGTQSHSSSFGPSPLSSLNGSSLPTGGGGYDPNPNNGASSLIGGIPIGRIGSQNLQTSSGSDLALLQSLLPGVHITSGRDSQSNWNGESGIVDPNRGRQQDWHIGANGQHNTHHQQNRGHGIW